MKAAPSTGFRRLVVATAIATFVLIIVGGIVRVSDSGLGCGAGGSGFHGWPFCNGDVVPGIDLNHIVEYTHRALAGTVSLMILALVVLSWRRHRQFLADRRSALLVLILAQAGLGGATVEENLDEVLVAAHLGLAMLLLGGLLYLWRGADGVARGERRAARCWRSPRAWRCSARSWRAATWPGTQKYGRPDYQLGDGAHHACGKQFPTCNGDFMPFGQSRLVDIHLTHRAFMYLASVLLIALIAVSLRRRVAVPYALGLAGAAGARRSWSAR